MPNGTDESEDVEIIDATTETAGAAQRVTVTRGPGTLSSAAPSMTEQELDARQLAKGDTRKSGPPLEGDEAGESRSTLGTLSSDDVPPTDCEE